MEPSRVDRILEEWAAVTGRAHRPATSPHRSGVIAGRAGATLAGATLVIAALVIAVAVMGRVGPDRGVGAIVSASPSATDTPIPTASPTASPSPTPTASPSPTPAPTPTPTPTATPAPTVGPCDPGSLAARITAWEGAAGHRIADLELTNAGTATCRLATMARPQLVDGHGSVLIDGTDPGPSKTLTLAPGDVVKTFVQDANYCGPDPVPPVSVAFVLDGGGRFTATPLSPTDATVPPCNGAPGSKGDIEMQPWAR
jgi:hypothetical protein